MNNDPEKKTNPKDDDDITFYFFFNIVKKLILNRHDVGDVCTLSSWLKALEDNTNKSVRNEYIKLMTLSLKHSKPMCPFKDAPPETIDPLENDVIVMSRKFLNNEGTATCVGEEIDKPDPPMSVAVSNDKRQYASCQVIPNVGVQCYFAYSDDHIYNWNLPPQVTVPKDGPHARHVEWERALAGIIPELYTPSTDNLKTNNARNDKDDGASSHSASGSGLSKQSKRKSRRSKVQLAGTDVCKVMNIEQQNRNINEDFVWNDSSLLTGEIILGAEMCSDRKVDAQTKTQLELDEEVISAYDKLYPGDFKMYVDSSVVNDIIPKKNFAMESGDKKIIQEQKLDERSSKKRIGLDDCAMKTQHNNHGKMYIDSKNSSNNIRQNAGQDTDIFHHCDLNKKINNQKSNIPELSPDFVNTKNHKTHKYVESRFPKVNTSSTNDILHFKRPVSKYRDTSERSKQLKDIPSLCQRDLLDCQRKIKMAEKCCDNARSSLQISRKESINSNLNPSRSDLDETSDA